MAACCSCFSTAASWSKLVQQEEGYFLGPASWQMWCQMCMPGCSPASKAGSSPASKACQNCWHCCRLPPAALLMPLAPKLPAGPTGAAGCRTCSTAPAADGTCEAGDRCWCRCRACWCPAAPVVAAGVAGWVLVLQEEPAGLKANHTWYLAQGSVCFFFPLVLKRS